VTADGGASSQVDIVPDFSRSQTRLAIGWRSRVIRHSRPYEKQDLAVYAGDKNAFHLPAWREFNRRVGSNGDVGIWHETYSVPAGHYEAIYNNMPAFGLGRVLPRVPAIGLRESARSRIASKQ
jgi:hypothetical protein